MNEYKFKVTRKRKSTTGITGIDPTAGAEVIYQDLPTKIKHGYNYKQEKFGDHIGGKVHGYAPLTVTRLKELDTLKSENREYKIIAPPRKGLRYVVLILERLK